MGSKHDDIVIGELGSLTAAEVRNALEGVPDNVLLNADCNGNLVFDGERKSLPAGTRVKLIEMPPPRALEAEKFITLEDEGVVIRHSGTDLTAVKFDNGAEVWLYPSNVERI